MSRQERRAALLFGVVASVVWAGAFLGWWGESLETAPVPDTKPPVTMGAVTVAAVGDGSIQGVVNDVVAWATEAETAAEASRQVAGVASVGNRSGSGVVASGDCESIPAWFPAYIAWRESKCTRGIDTGNGYLGYAQIALFHWSGLCAGLDWTVDSDYDECVARLWNGGAGASHWAAG